MELTNDPNFVIPSSFVTDFFVEAQLSPTVFISAFVNNLFNNEYYTYGAPSDVFFTGNEQPGFYAQPIEITL